MTRWLITGATGMLGRDLVEVCRTDPTLSLVALGRAELDITDPAAVRAAVAGAQLVINAAAWTDVDGAERHEQQAHAVNAGGVTNLAAACQATGALLIHVSTDYVFAGDASTPYAEDAPVAPGNAYGRSKLAGEQAVLRLLPTAGYVVRTAWLYGAHGRNFVRTMLRLAAQRPTVDVVADQRGAPTWSYALASGLVELGRAALSRGVPPGVYHLAAAGETTWFELAREVFAQAGLDPSRVRPITSEQYAANAAVPPACRPAYSVLGQARWVAAGLTPLPHWRPMLHQALRTPGFAAGTRPPVGHDGPVQEVGAWPLAEPGVPPAGRP